MLADGFSALFAPLRRDVDQVWRRRPRAFKLRELVQEARTDSARFDQHIHVEKSDNLTHAAAVRIALNIKEGELCFVAQGGVVARLEEGRNVGAEW